MKKPERRFEAVPISEIFKRTTQAEDQKIVEKLSKKEEPYAVPCRVPGEAPSR